MAFINLIIKNKWKTITKIQNIFRLTCICIIFYLFHLKWPGRSINLWILLKKHNGNGSFLGVKALNKWHAWLLQILSETEAGYTLQREVIHTQTKGGNINTTQREVIIIHTYRQQEVIRYTHTDKGRKYTKQNITLDQTQSCYTIHTGVYTGC